MKRILFILALVMSAMCVTGQESVKVTTKDGTVIVGTFVDGTNETYTIKCAKDIRSYVISKYGTDTVIFDLEDIHHVQMYGKVFVPINGKLIVADTGKNVQKSEIKLNPVSNTYSLQPSNPGEVIGKAMKTTGAVSLGFGIPCLLAGTILTAVGHSGFTIDLNDGYLTEKEALDKLVEIGNKGTNRSNMQIAGYVLLPIGASLTIIGIPLHVHGKKIMTMNFNYTGNGVGVGVEF